MPYSNITLQNVSQDVVAEHLRTIERVAWISPTVNGFTIVYDAALGAPPTWDFLALTNKLSSLKSLISRYSENSIESVIACLTLYFSTTFRCTALGIYSYDDSDLWYCCYSSGLFVDEYINAKELVWRNKEISSLEIPKLVKGGNANNLGEAFSIHNFISTENLQMILSKPNGYDYIDVELSSRYQSLLHIESYDSLMRHEALSRTLGIHPCWVLGLDYPCITQGDMRQFYEESIFDEDQEFPFEEAYTLLRNIG